MRYRCSSVVVAILLALLAVSSPARAQNERAVLDQVLALYKTHDVVLLGEQHDRRLNFEFRMALLKHPKFASTVQDIVIECANSRYQQVLDDFVLRLQDVPAERLRDVWRNTTMPTGVWDSPIYEEFIRAVRAVNASLLPAKRIRLVAGDPPIDWAVITTPEQVVPFLQQRDETAYTAIEKESLQKHRKALVIYGSGHFLPLGLSGHHSIGSYLREKYQGRIYTILPLSGAQALPLQGLAGIRTAPTLLEIAGSDLARLPANEVFGPSPLDAPAGDLMDAILYLGTGADEIVRARADVVNDTVYQNELKRRLDLMTKAAPRGLPPKK
jgi:hypothetical protein